MRDTRKKFLVGCPYCGSVVKVKANHKLKFKSYYFSDNIKVYRYDKVPIWKCSCCRQKFVVDMLEKASYTIEQIPKIETDPFVMSIDDYERLCGIE